MIERKIHDAYVFALGDDFDYILRHLSVDYLKAGWRQLQDTLRHSEQVFTDLRFGWLHPGLTVIDLPDSPIAYFGWISTQTLPPGPKEKPFRELDRRLADSVPRLRWGASNRGLDFGIRPDSFVEGLEACVMIGTEEASDWNPDSLVDADRPNEPWRNIARAIRDQDRKAFEAEMESAEALYSPDGFRIVKKGFELWNRDGIHPLR